MAQGRATPPETRARIIQMLQSGGSVGETARALGVGKSTVSLIGRQAGVVLARTMNQRITRAAADFNAARRLEALNEFAEAVRDRVKAGGLSAKELRDVGVALGIVVQRSREERGEDRGPAAPIAQLVIYIPDNGRQYASTPSAPAHDRDGVYLPLPVPSERRHTSPLPTDHEAPEVIDRDRAR